MSGLLARVAPYRKLAVFIVGTVLELCIQVWGTGNVYVALGVLVATGLGIYQVPNAGQLKSAEATVLGAVAAAAKKPPAKPGPAA